MTVVDTGLAAEFAAIYAYSEATVHLDGEPRELAESLESEHRDRRDALLDYYDAHGLESTPAEPGYSLERVTEADEVEALLLDVETRVATTWRAGLASDDPDEREICLNMYTDSAKALARWKIAIGQSYADPWPGRPV
ncbi:ferritin-like domain-containing protein [Glycomyces buryatensis]|uniref:DUF4439 domain-containing protein n=1 Tax=Glycomyces buryatensis TaxID=2570927 RepID=A0A4V4HSW3_9ACTN|nr:ferritin-like domain-containing protein [Glycomyces buryatensis]THV43246.1 DUF4439 domain-containing protein [Glycomyces buryatensis]